MFTIIGLGNPGKRYFYTRHNVGFLLLDYIASKLNFPFEAGKGDYYYIKCEINNSPVIFVKPTTYMNNSGLVLQQIDDFIQADTEKLLIAYDDFHLPFGTLRFRPKGSDAGHNGIKSIIYHLQTDLFSRLRIGIGTEFENSIDHVLSPFEQDEIMKLPDLFEESYKGIITWMQSGIEAAMNNHNRNVLDMLR